MGDGGRGFGLKITSGYNCYMTRTPKVEFSGSAHTYEMCLFLDSFNTYTNVILILCSFFFYLFYLFIYFSFIVLLVGHFIGYKELFYSLAYLSTLLQHVLYIAILYNVITRMLKKLHTR